MIRHLWLILSLVCIGWYIVIFGYVVVKGGGDIKQMLKSLSDKDLSEDSQ